MYKIKPNFLKNLSDKEITGHPCINCLLDTEKYIQNGNFSGLNKGDYKWYKTFSAETDELKNSIRKIAPKKCLKLDAGQGE
ncbi:MAG: hypothetical protein V1824_04745 [archaeon]